MKTLLSCLLAVASLATPGALRAQADDHDHHGHAHGPANKPNDSTPEELERKHAAEALTDKKLTQYLTYERELITSDATTALRKAKLKAQEANEVAALVRGYFVARQAAIRNETELNQLRVAGRALTEADQRRMTLLSRRGEEHARWRDDFATRYGAKVRALLDKREAEFVKVLDDADAALEKREAEAKTAAATGLNEERINRYLGFLRAPIGLEPKARDEALRKAGLEAKVADGLALLAGEYYRHRFVADSDAEQLAAARKRMSETPAVKRRTDLEERLERHYSEKLDAFDEFQKQFAARWGKDVPGLFDKFSGEFKALYSKLGASGGPGTHPPAAPTAPAPAAGATKPAAKP